MHTLLGCSGLYMLPLFLSITIRQLYYRSPLIWAVVTCVAVPEAIQRDQGKLIRGTDSCGCLQSAGNARWLPYWFSDPLPILYHHLSCSVSEVCSRSLIFLTCASQILQMSTLYTCGLEVWFMNGCRQEYSFWQQKQIMEETEWSNWWPLSLLLTSAGSWPISLKGALLGIDVRGRLYLNRFSPLILNVYSQSE